MALKRIVLFSVSSLVLLSGCEGYEMVKTNTMFPYGNQRTAGSGVAYVLAKMMPEKELQLEPVAKEVERDWKPEVMEMLPEPKHEAAQEPVAQTEADKIFLDASKK